MFSVIELAARGLRRVRDPLIESSHRSRRTVCPTQRQCLAASQAGPQDQVQDLGVAQVFDTLAQLRDLLWLEAHHFPVRRSWTLDSQYRAGCEKAVDTASSKTERRAA
jgi:hypothetical protein